MWGTASQRCEMASVLRWLCIFVVLGRVNTVDVVVMHVMISDIADQKSNSCQYYNIYILGHA